MTYPSCRASRCLDEWIDGLTSVTQLAEQTEFQHAIDTFRFESKYQTDNGLTQCAADDGYAARFLSLFVALSFFRFDGESRPAHQYPEGA